MGAGFTTMRASPCKSKLNREFLETAGGSGRIAENLAPRLSYRRANIAEPLVIKLDLINEVVTKTGVTKTKAEMAVETVFESMKKALSHGDRIELRGFGVFTVRPRKTGIGRNPRTGAEVNIPPGKAVRFKPGKELQSIE